MATIPNLVKEGKLIPYVPELEAWEHKQRSIYISEELANWFDDELGNAPTEQGHRVSPAGYTHAILKRFVVGERLVLNDAYKQLEFNRPVWAFRPNGARVFGYFYRKSVFVGVCGDLRKNLTSADYNERKSYVTEFMNNIGLDKPLCITSGLPRNVL